MRRKKESLRKSARIFEAALFFLVTAFICFGLDFFHWSRHLGHDGTLWGLPGVGLKLAWKGGLFCLSLILLMSSRKIFVFIVTLALALAQGEALARAASASCERAREMMKESGMAREAREDFLGRLKITPPRSSFPPEMDQVTWWGTFRPFEFWESPRLEAAWINPRGIPTERQSFRGGACQLAKTTLRVDGLPQRKLEPGMWRVIVSCEDVVVDNHPFAVTGSPTSSQDRKDSGMMIWANDLKER